MLQYLKSVMRRVCAHTHTADPPLNSPSPRALQSFSVKIMQAGQDLSGLRKRSTAVTRAAAAAAISAAAAGGDDLQVEAAANRAASAAASALAAGGGALLPVPVSPAVEEAAGAITRPASGEGKSRHGDDDDGWVTVLTDGASLAIMLAALIIMFMYVKDSGEVANQAISRCVAPDPA